MAIQDILPITSIALIINGSIIMLIGLIWSGKLRKIKDPDTEASNTDYIIEEMNQMFSYFTSKIDNEETKLGENLANPEDSYDELDNKKYKQVINLSKKGRTSEEIAKELDIGKGEVNLILGIEQMR